MSNSQLTPAQAEIMFTLDRHLTAAVHRAAVNLELLPDTTEDVAFALLMSVLGRLAAQLAVSSELPEAAYLQGLRLSYAAVTAQSAMERALKRAAEGEK
jgi:hypothetical protein